MPRRTHIFESQLRNPLNPPSHLFKPSTPKDLPPSLPKGAKSLRKRLRRRVASKAWRMAPVRKSANRSAPSRAAERSPHWFVGLKVANLHEHAFRVLSFFYFKSLSHSGSSLPTPPFMRSPASKLQFSAGFGIGEDTMVMKSPAGAVRNPMSPLRLSGPTGAGRCRDGDNPTPCKKPYLLRTISSSLVLFSSRSVVRKSDPASG